MMGCFLGLTPDEKSIHPGYTRWDIKPAAFAAGLLQRYLIKRV
jgi:hypothetical protein